MTNPCGVQVLRTAFLAAIGFAVSGCGGGGAPKKDDSPKKAEAPVREDLVVEGRPMSAWLKGVGEEEAEIMKSLEGNRVLAITVAVAALKGDDAELRVWGAGALGDGGGFPREEKISRAFKPAVAALVDALATDDVRLRSTAVWALGRIGPPAAAAVPAILEIVKAPDAVPKGTDESLHKRAADALGWMAGPEAIAALTGLAKADEVKVRRAAVQALGFLGERHPDHAKEIVPTLVTALESDADRDRWVRVNACRALAVFSGSSADAKAALTKAATDADGDVRSAAKLATARPPGR